MGKLSKFISFVLIVCFSINQVAFGNTLSQPGVPVPTQSAAAPAAQLQNFATVSDFYSRTTQGLFSQLKDSREKLIVLIEDAHGIISAQENIAGAIQAVAGSAGLTEPWIALEGTGKGEIDHRVLSTFPHKPTRDLVAKFFLKTGDIDGADYYAATSNPKARLFGVDDNDLAEQNRESYRDYVEGKGDAEKVLAHLRKVADFLKGKIYYGDLIRLDKSVSAFEHTPNHLLKHLKTLEELAKKNNVGLAQYPHISALIELKTIEAQSAHKQDKKRFEGLTKKLASVPVFEEINQLTEALWAKLLNYREAQDAHAIDRAVSFYEKLFDFALTPGDLDSSRALGMTDIGALKEKIADYNFVLQPKTVRLTDAEYATLKRASKSPLNFYRLAKERDSVLAKNLLQLAAQNPGNKTFFVSGGFHRQAITETLKKSKISYVVLSPKITSKDGAENYWRALGGYKDNLETNLAAMTVKIQDQFMNPDFRKKTEFFLVGCLYTNGEVTAEDFYAHNQDYQNGLALPERSFLDSLLKTFEKPADGWATATFNNNQFLLEATPAGQKAPLPSGIDLANFTRLAGEVIDGVEIALWQDKRVRTMPIPVTPTRAEDFKLQASGLNPIETEKVVFAKLKGTDEQSLGAFAGKLIAEMSKSAEGIGLHLDVDMLGEFFKELYSFYRKSDPSLAAAALNKLQNTSFKVDFDNYRELFSIDQRDPKNLVIQVDLPSLRAFEKQSGDDVVPFLPEVLLATAIFGHYLFGHLVGVNNENELLERDQKNFIMLLQGLEKSPNFRGFPFARSFIGVLNQLIDRNSGEDMAGSSFAKRLSSLHSKSASAESSDEVAPDASSVRELGPGALLGGRYRIEKKIGQGGFGAVWLATDTKLGSKLVAVKELMPEKLTPDNRARFNREMEIMGILDNPRLAQVQDRIEPTGDYSNEYVVLTFAPGKPLTKLVPKPGQPRTTEHLNDKELLQVAIETLKALEIMHNHKNKKTGATEAFMHRDIKPDNIMVDFDREKGTVIVTVLDLGMAKPPGTYGFGESGELKQNTVTMQGAIIGTPWYMSPEQVLGLTKDLTTATDVYSFGTMLYYMMTGSVSVNPTNESVPVNTLIMRHVHPHYPAPNELNATIDEELNRIILRAMAAQFPNAPPTFEVPVQTYKGKTLIRYRDATELLTDLEAYYAKHYGIGSQAGVAPLTLALPPVDDGKNLELQPIIKAPPAKSSKRAEAVGPVARRARELASKQKPPAKKNNLVVFGGIGAAVAALVIGAVVFMGKGKETPPPSRVPDGSQTVVTTEDPGKQEDGRKQAEQAKIAQELAGIKIAAGSLDKTLSDIDSVTTSMQKTLADMKSASEKAGGSLDNVPTVEQLVANVQKGKKEIDSQNTTAGNHAQSYRDKLKEIQDRLVRLASNTDITPQQKSEVDSLLKEMGKRQSSPDSKVASIEDLIKQSEGYLETVTTALAAAKDPTRKNPILADAELKKVRELLSKLSVTSQSFTDMDKALADLAKLKADLGTKSAEVVALSAAIEAGIEKLAKTTERTKPEDVKKITDENAANEQKLAEAVEALLALQVAQDGILKTFDAGQKAVEVNLLLLDQSVAAMKQLVVNDPKVATKGDEMTVEANKAKPVRDALADKMAKFQVVQADVTLASQLAVLDAKAAACELALTRVETVWDKNKSDVSKWQSAKDKSKEEQDTAKKVYKELPDLIKTFKSSAVGLPARPGLAGQMLALKKQAKPDAKAVDALYQKVFDTDKAAYDEAAFLKSASDLLTSVSLTLDAGALTGMRTILKWNGKNLNDFEFYNQTSKIDEPNFLIQPDPVSKQPCIVRGPSDYQFLFAKNILEINEKNNIDISMDAYIDGIFVTGLCNTAEMDGGNILHIYKLVGAKLKVINSDKLKFPSDNDFEKVKLFFWSESGTEICDVPQQKWAKLRFVKAEKSDQIQLFLDGKAIYTQKIGKGEYKLFFIFGNQAAGGNSGRISNLEIKGKSLGRGEGMGTAALLFKKSQAVIKNGLLVIPFDTKLLKNLLAGGEMKLFKNLPILILAKSDSELREARELLKPYKNVFKFRAIKLEREIGELRTEDQDMLTRQASLLFGVAQAAVGKPVLLNDDFFRNNLLASNRAELIPVHFAKERFLSDPAYRLAYLTTSLALSKGEVDKSIFVKNSDGSLSLAEELIQDFSNYFEAISALARAA